MRAFLGVSIHFIDDNWNYKSYLLDCFRFTEKQTGENIVKKFGEMIYDYLIPKKLTHIVSDNAAICI